jgi:hypothetical protein
MIKYLMVMKLKTDRKYSEKENTVDSRRHSHKAPPERRKTDVGINTPDKSAEMKSGQEKLLIQKSQTTPDFRLTPFKTDVSPIVNRKS